MISNQDPQFISHFRKVLTKKLGVQQNLSTAFHPQIDSLEEQKNQWVEQYLQLVTSANLSNWVRWVSIAAAVHNNKQNATTGLLPNQVLLGYKLTLTPLVMPTTTNQAAEDQVQTMIN